MRRGGALIRPRGAKVNEKAGAATGVLGSACIYAAGIGGAELKDEWKSACCS